MKNFRNRLQTFFPKQVRQSVARVFTAVCVVSAVVMALYMLAMRFAFLNGGLTYDELYSAITASPQFSLGFVWKEMLLQDLNLPLFNILLFGWNRVFPFTVFWMHLFPALTGAAAVAAAWFFAPAYWTRLRKCIFVTLVSCSFIFVAYGKIVRTYSLSILLTVIFSLLALRFIHQFEQGKKPSLAQWLLFFIVGFLGAYSHFFCSGLFFITALVLFLYALYYRVCRKISFWGTAVVFFLWVPWLVHVGRMMSAPTGTWWIHTPFLKSTSDIFIFLFGPRHVFIFMVYIAVLACVSIGFMYKKTLLKQADVVLPLAQIVLLCGVVAVVSVKFNLWLDRYFLPLLVSLLLLFTEFLDHLRKRHLVLLVLWPLLLIGWIQFFGTLDYLSWPEYTGLRDVFTRLTQTEKVDKLLVDLERTGYPRAALMPMFSFYIPPGTDLELIELTPQNVSMSWETNPKTYILVPLCSQVALLDTSLRTHSEEEHEPFVFGKETCLYTARPVKKRRSLYEKNIFSF